MRVKVINCKNPKLTIITRVMEGRRPTLYAKHMESIRQLNDRDKIQFIYIFDDEMVGFHEANKFFHKVAPLIKGKKVFLLDDDDFFTVKDFVKQVDIDADIVYFKMIILNGQNNNTYPTVDVWKKKPIAGQIGGSCFVVERELWKKNIHLFGQPRMGDWSFIHVVHEKANKIKWIDKIMCQTGRVSRGKPE